MTLAGGAGGVERMGGMPGGGMRPWDKAFGGIIPGTIPPGGIIGCPEKLGIGPMQDKGFVEGRYC